VCSVDPQAPQYVCGDPLRLRQVLVNLAGNAVKFTERGEVVVRVELVSRGEKDATLQFSVSDTGVGIARDRHKAIFDCFTQGDGSTTRKYGGTGLGLTICKQFVELMGGQIEVDSEPGKGSTFRFGVTMPYARSTAGAGPQGGSASDSAILKGKRLLIVDDNAAGRLALSATLASWGCEVDDAAGGNEGLEKLRAAHARRFPFDLVLLDVQMPKMDGPAVARQIWSDATCGHPKVAFAGSVNDRGDLDRDSAERVDGHLAKPVKQSVLMDLLLTVFGAKAPSGSAPGGSKARATERRFEGVRALLADDNEVNREVGVGVLKKLGCDARQAQNGREALEFLQGGSYDIVFMDVQMPEMDGFEATRQIRAASCRPDLPIIAMTAHAMKGDRERCLEAGMNDYIAKPIQVQDVRGALEKWLPERLGLARADSRIASDRDALMESPGPQPMDIEKALERLGGDRELLDRVIATFLKTFPQLVADLRSAHTQRDPRRVQGAAHSLKGSAATVAAEQVRSLAERLEQIGASGTLDGADRLLAELDAHLTRIHSFAATYRS